MRTETQMKSALQAYVDAYNRNDLPALLALYSDDATVEDPYGTPAKVGKLAIEDFYRDAMLSGAVLRLSAPIRGSMGDSAAMAFEAVINTPQGEMRVRVIDLMTFNEAGLITSMRAYFGESDIEAAH